VCNMWVMLVCVSFDNIVFYFESLHAYCEYLMPKNLLFDYCLWVLWHLIDFCFLMFIIEKIFTSNPGNEIKNRDLVSYTYFVVPSTCSPLSFYHTYSEMWPLQIFNLKIMIFNGNILKLFFIPYRRLLVLVLFYILYSCKLNPSS
jgi:hypothetical protein